MDKNSKNIIDSLLKFRSERDWEQFHRPKDLAISIVLEAAELLEEFQWKTDEEVKKYLAGDGLNAVREEIADIAIYLLLMSNDLGIDPVAAIKDKIRKNEAKYPVSKAKGSSKKYDKL
ncbi:MAG: nucleotide pyrophosphohydrolase [Nitrospirae bacterium]|nr:nucleotide pyrophosphohydrolase [Nitrospirota bacterium]MCL5238549.1 nucleotide pyrophosphohydrolase [Nitrospirota bacterium]